jgi:hypothetical protein
MGVRQFALVLGLTCHRIIAAVTENSRDLAEQKLGVLTH